MLKNMLIIKNIILACLFVLLQSCGGTDKGNYTITASETFLNFSATSQEELSHSVKIDVDFSGDGILVGFAPDVTLVPWLSIKAENITNNSATVIIELEDTEQLPPNLYKTKVRLSTGKIDGINIDLVHHDIDISMLVARTVSFKAVVGETNVASKTSTVISSTDNSWGSSTEVSWLTTELKADIETKALTLTNTIDIESLTDPGLYNTEVTLKNSLTNEELIIPVELGLDNIYLFADQSYIPLVSTPNIKVIESVITISNNAAKDIEWIAATSFNWLTLTPSEDRSTLTVSADISKVNENEISLAEIIIESKNPNEAITETVNVSLFHSTTLTERKLADINNLPVNNNAITTSLSQPFIYIGINNEIKIFHLYTGELVNTLIASPENTNIEQFIMHPKKGFFLAQATETINNDGVISTEIHRYKINLTENTIVEIKNSTIATNPESFIRLSGRYFVLTEALEFADENLKRLYFNRYEVFSPTTVEIASHTGAIFTIDNTDSISSKIKRFDVEVNDYTKEIITSNLTHSYHPESVPEDEDIQDLVVTDDEKNIYIISSTSEWISFDGVSFTDNGLLERKEVVLNFNEEQQILRNDDIISNADDVITHSVYINDTNKPHYIRTIKVPNTSPIIYNTYINTYNTQQQLITDVLTSENRQSFNVSPVDINFSLSAQHIIVNDKTVNEVRFNLVTFIPDTYQITFNVPLDKPENNRFIVDLGNIGNPWTTLKNADWIELFSNPLKPKELIVNLTNYDTLEAGIYHDELTVYDVTNQASATIKVTLNIE